MNYMAEDFQHWHYTTTEEWADEREYESVTDTVRRTVTVYGVPAQHDVKIYSLTDDRMHTETITGEFDTLAIMAYADGITL